MIEVTCLRPGSQMHVSNAAVLNLFGSSPLLCLQCVFGEQGSGGLLLRGFEGGKAF